MSSEINPFNINGSFPIAGQDNDSQGFRDNFTNTRNNFNLAKTELEDLQNKVVLKSPLSGELATDAAYNNLNGTVLTAPELKAWRSTKVLKDPAGASVDVDFSAGNFYQLVTNASTTLSFSGFPNDAYSAIRVWLTVDASHTVTLPSGVMVGASTIEGFNVSDDSVTFAATGSYLWEISSYNGSTFFIEDLSRNRNAVTTLAISNLVTFTPLAAEPSGAIDGTVAVANGLAAGWDPASVGGTTSYPVYYDGAAWHKMI